MDYVVLQISKYTLEISEYSFQIFIRALLLFNFTCLREIATKNQNVLKKRLEIKLY